MVKINPQQPEPVKHIVDQMGIVMEKVYNPSVGTYDVCVTTGPGYMTKRQEALDAMSMLLQSNPQLWSVAGDLFIKNMDWPGAQEMAKRFAKIIDPKVMDGEDESPEMQQAKQQIEAMTQHMQQMEGMLSRVQQSMEAQQLDIERFNSEVKAYDAETKRISAVQASMSPEQIQDIVMGTIHAAIDTGDIISGMPDRGQLEQNELGEMPEAPPQMPPPPEMMGQGQ